MPFRPAAGLKKNMASILQIPLFSSTRVGGRDEKVKPLLFRLPYLLDNPTSGLCRSGSRGYHPGNSRQRSRNRNRLHRARQCRWRDRSRQGRLRRWGGRSRRTCSRIRRYRTGQGSHERNCGESGTASCSPRSGSRHAICRKWENPNGDRRPHRTRHPGRPQPYREPTRFP